MIQTIIAILIIVAAVVIAVLFSVRKIRKLKQPDPCRNCNAACGDCTFYKEMQKSKKPRKEKPGSAR